MMNGLSIVIPTKGTSTQLVALLKSLSLQQVTFNFEVVIIVNSADTADYEAVKESLQFDEAIQKKLNISLYYITRAGVNSARNLGLENSKFDLILLLDDDCEADSPTLLAQHFQKHNALPSLFALGGVYSLEKKASFFDRLYHFIQMRWLYEGLKTEEHTHSYYLIGGHFSVKKRMLIEYKILFNEKIVYGGSELEFFLKANQHDLRMELSELSILHKTDESFTTLMRKLYKQGKGKAISEENFPSQPYLYSENQSGVWTHSKRMNLFLVYFNYVFWFGYYTQKKNRLQFFRHVLKSFIRLLQGKKFLLIRQLEMTSLEKKNRGDRV